MNPLLLSVVVVLVWLVIAAAVLSAIVLFGLAWLAEAMDRCRESL